MKSAFLMVLFFATPLLAQDAKLSDLGWISGCWQMTDVRSGRRITEMWMRPDGSAMLGVGRTISVKDGKLSDYEFLRIVRTEDGIAYISRPKSNKEDTSFKLVESSQNKLVFENLEHDFPQRIIYKRVGLKLTARIEGMIDGNMQGVDFPYTRAKCE